MNKITIEINGITASHEFPKDDPVLDIIRAFYTDQVARDQATDQGMVEEVLLWFVDKLYRGARQQHIERARDEAAKEAEQRYEFKRPTRTEGEGSREPEDLGGADGGSDGSDPPRTRASSAGVPAD